MRAMLIGVIVFSILWVLARPDLWMMALSFAVIATVMLALAHSAGMKQGREKAMAENSIPQNEEDYDEG